MSHLHMPDGVLPTWLWIAGWLITLGLVWAAGIAGRGDLRRGVPLLAVVSAIMLVAMSSEIVPIAYHINLTVVGGALLGPALAPIAAFIVVTVLALLGHGGVTVIGVNTLMIAGEMVVGWALFSAAVRLLGAKRAGIAAAVATVATLAITTAVLVGVVALAGSGAALRETGALDPSTLKFESPFSGGLFEQGLLGGGEASEGQADGEGRGSHPLANLSVERFAATVFILGPFGWALEAFISALVLGYVARVRPSLLFGGARPERVVPGDEAGGH